MLLLATLACVTDDPAPSDSPAFGLPLVQDGTLYAGIARVDITPTMA
jgi:hypothetical protein